MTETLIYWCGGACLFSLGVLAFIVALLRFGGSNRYENRRAAELTWQANSRNTDWWMDINRSKED